MSQSAARRTQEERRASTQARLLDATIASLLDVGYASTTTRRVAELAGVSVGAQSHHFPRRTDLVVAACERLIELRIAELRTVGEDLPRSGPARVRASIDVIWRDFASDLFTVLVKLWVAAADDAELYARMVPLERSVARAVREISGAIMGDVVKRIPDYPARFELAVSAIRGLALQRSFEPAGRTRRDPWPAQRRLLEELLAA